MTITMGGGQPAGQKTPEHAANDAEACRLRVAGFTYREIATHVGCSPTVAHQRVKRALAAVPAQEVAELRSVEAERLDALWKIAWAQATKDHVMVQMGKVVRNTAGEPLIDHGPKIQAVNTLLKIQERRAKLFGLDEPTKTRIEVITEDTVDQAIRQLEEEIAERERAAAEM